MNRTQQTFYLETLGCPRNESDSEAIVNILTSSGFKVVKYPEKADIIIVNGCAFINNAVEETIDSILSLKNINKNAVLVVVGCFAQRYGQELLDNMDEIDLLIGTGSYERIPELITNGKTEVSSNYGFIGKNIYAQSHVTPVHYRYIKIQEGCNYKCAFCVIPSLKGVSHSKSLQCIKEEISNLPESVKEIILIGQNTTSWGKDLSGDNGFSELIPEVASVFSGWIRFLYFHPLAISANLLETMKNLPNVINYLDIPLQHVSDSVLSDMNRGYGSREIEELLGLIKSFGDFTLRTTFIVGFPSETEKNFEELCSFVKKKDIDHIGVFPYSHEEGAQAFSMQCLPDRVIEKRVELISEIVEKKTSIRNKNFIGRKMEVLIDGIEEGEYYGRTKTSAPDIDPVVWILPSDKKLRIGETYRVLITEVLGGDFGGEISLD